MAYELPIVGTLEEGGVRFRVRAIPWGLAREASRPGADVPAVAAKIFARCVEAEDGETPDVDDLPMSLVMRLVDIASRAEATGDGADPR